MPWMDARGIARVVGTLLLVGACAFIAWSWRSIISVPSLSASDGTLERLVAVPVVIASLRIAFVILSAYLVASSVGLLLEGRWLVRAGPSGAEVEPADMLDRLQDGSFINEDRLTDLEESVDEVWDVIGQSEDRVDGEE